MLNTKRYFLETYFNEYYATVCFCSFYCDPKDTQQDKTKLSTYNTTNDTLLILLTIPFVSDVKKHTLS